MDSPYVRPKVSELLFRLYSRALHPELFDVLAVRRVERDGYRLSARITRSGHVLSCEVAGVCLTEATVTADQVLPDYGKKFTHRFSGERRGHCDIAPGLRYQFSTQVEVLPPELFHHVHEDLRSDGERKGLVSHFRPHDRLGLTPLGVVIVEALPDCLSVNAFHTFPDEFAIVKTQSLIEFA